MNERAKRVKEWFMKDNSTDNYPEFALLLFDLALQMENSTGSLCQEYLLMACYAEWYAQTGEWPDHLFGE